MPDWLTKPALAEERVRPITPSTIGGALEAEAAESGGATPSLDDDPSPAFSPAGAGEAPLSDPYFRGRVLHRLLELLPSVPDADRVGVADRLLHRLAPEIALTAKEAWRDEVLAVLRHPRFAPAFGPDSRAEVPIIGEVDGRPVSGQIDRLMVRDGEVFCIDFKTNRPPPRKIEDAPPAYLAQLALYRALLAAAFPGARIRCALLWTYEPRLVEAPEELIDHAYARIARES